MLKPVLYSFFLLTAASNTATAAYLDRSAWSWRASSVCVPEGDDITGLEGIHDGNMQTCWHSNWHAAEGSPERSQPHWIMIDRGTDRTPFTGLAYTPRQASASQTCTSYYIYLRDTDLSNTPATSLSDIVGALGAPDASGSWEGTTDEKFAPLAKPSTARYILFVNISSLNSSSAACAEMNLTNGDGGGTGTAPFNAVKITPVKGSAPHRIAVRGSELSLSMNFGYIRLSNSEITIEYSPDEVSRFNLEQYDFGETFYNGSKKDIYSSTFPLVVTPGEGELAEIKEITLSTVGAPTRINPEVSDPIRLVGDNNILIRAITPEELPAIAVGTDYVISSPEGNNSGHLYFTVPEGLLIDPDGARSEAVDMAWTITNHNSGQDAITAAYTECPTIIFSHSGGNLTVSGITGTSDIALIDTAGHTVMTAKVSPAGSATFAVGSLPHGVYLLVVNETTLKIIL